MATKQPAESAPSRRYEFPGYPDDPTLGGAISPEMADALESGTPLTAPGRRDASTGGLAPVTTDDVPAS